MIETSLRALASIAIALLLTACADETSQVEARVLELEQRVQRLEQSSGAPEVDAAVVGTTSLPGRSVQESRDDAKARVAEVQSSGDTNLRSVADAAFADSPFLGFPLDPEFGGLLVEGDDRAIKLVFDIEGLSETSLLEVLLAALGFDESLFGRIAAPGGDGTATSFEGGLSAAWVWDSDERLEVDVVHQE